MALNTIFLLCSYKGAQTQTKDKSLSFALQVHCHKGSHAFDTVPNFFFFIRIEPVGSPEPKSTSVCQKLGSSLDSELVKEADKYR